MRVVLVCPACGEALRVEHLPGPVACPNCFQSFALAARETVTRELETPADPGEVRRPRPFLLTVWMGITLLYAAKMILLLLVTASLSRPIRADGKEMSAGAFVLSYLLMSATALLMVAGAFGIWKERRWTRGVLLATWLSFVAIVIASAVSQSSGLAVVYPPNFTRMALAEKVIPLLPLLAGLAVSWWYLYRKPNVVGYFEAIERGRGRA